jgi:hypothetical protein
MDHSLNVYILLRVKSHRSENFDIVHYSKFLNTTITTLPLHVVLWGMAKFGVVLFRNQKVIGIAMARTTVTRETRLLDLSDRWNPSGPVQAKYNRS